MLNSDANRCLDVLLKDTLAQRGRLPASELCNELAGHGYTRREAQRAIRRGLGRGTAILGRDLWIELRENADEPMVL